MELLSEVLVNNGMKNMQEYKVCEIYAKHPADSLIRHVNRNGIYLCGFSNRYKAIFPLYNYSINDIAGVKNVPICKVCLNKLPKKVKEEFIYNWTVTKLKTK